MRGKTKIGTTALMLSVILSSILMAVIPVSANPTASLEMPIMTNPLFEVGDTFTADVLVRDVTKLWSFEFTLYYDTSVLTCIDYGPVRANPVGMINLLPSGIDDENGMMWMGATRAIGDTTGVTTEPGLPILIALVTFRIDARGVSPLIISEPTTPIVLTDVYGNTIDSIGIDGSFNNELQGYLMVSKIIDTGLAPGSTVDIYVSVRKVYALWGVQFLLYLDPNVLTPVAFEGLDPLDHPVPADVDEYPYVEELLPNGFRMTWHSFYNDEVGLTTEDPYPVAKLTCTVKALGVTQLKLKNTVMADVNGNKLIHGTEDGLFSNTYAVGVALDTGFVEDHNYQLSKDPDATITMTGQVKTVDVGVTTARVRFTVLDADGYPVGSLLSEEVSIVASGNYRLTAGLAASGLLMPALYDVVFQVEYLDGNGVWTSGQKGSASGNKSIMIKAVTVEL